ncbi:MAG: TonB-dependent receptor [Desulfobacterales bacterium]|nr:TonB-dependent receptor [Desulfobacterales bacterium]
MKKFWIVWVVCMAYAMTETAFADPDSKQANYAMDEMVVTATKKKEKRKDISNSVVVLDAIDIEESSVKSLGELLANEPGLDWRTRGNYGGAAEEIKIRGMSSNGTQLLLNGMSMNSPSLGTADASRISLNNIERVEVVKGSGSLLYGSGAMGGTVNIITKRPERDVIDLKASAGYGSNDFYQLSAEQGMYITESIGYYLTANRKETDGFRDNGDLTHHDFSGNLIFNRGDALDISLYGDFIGREYGIPGPKPPAGTTAFSLGGTPFISPESSSLVNRGETKDKHLSFKIKGRPADWLGLSLKQDYLDTESYDYRRNPAAVWPKAAGEGQKTWVYNTVKVTEVSADIEPSETYGILVGGEYKDFEYTRKAMDLDAGGADLPATAISNDYHVYSKGAFAEGRFRLSRLLKVTAGVRGAWHSMFATETLPRYGLIIQPLEKTVLKLSHGKHFRAPTMNDLYWPDDGWTRGNPNLTPEKGWHTDVTVEQELLDNKFFLTASYFRWDIKDKIAWAENPAFPTAFPGFNKWTPSNVDSFEADGLEIGTKIGPWHNAIFSLSYTLMDPTEQKKGGPERQAQYTPKSQFKTDLVYWTEFDLTITTTARYTDNRPAHYLNDNVATPAITLGSYWTVDAKLAQRLLDHWVVTLEGTNLLDKAYDTYVEFHTDPTGTMTREMDPGAGRAFFFNVIYEY